MNFKDALLADMPDEESFLRTLAQISAELTRNETRAAAGVSKAVAEILDTSSASEKSKYFALQALNLCVMLTPDSMDRAMQPELKRSLLRLAHSEPKKGTAAQKAKRFIQKSGGRADENYAVYLFELLIESIECWHATDEDSELPLFREMYYELVKAGVVFVEEPSHVTKYLGFIQGLKDRSSPWVAETESRREFPASLDSSKVRNVLLKDSILVSSARQSEKNFMAESSGAMGDFGRAFRTILGFFRASTEAGPRLLDLLGQLEDAIQKTAPVKHQLTKADLVRIKDGLFILSSHYQTKDYSRLRKLVLDQFGGDEKLPDAGSNPATTAPKMIESITPPSLPSALGPHPLASKSASPSPLNRPLQSTNCLISFKQAQPPQAKPPMGGESDLAKTIHPNSNRKSESKVDTKSAESVKETFSFRSFDGDKNADSSKKSVGNVFKDEGSSYLAQFVEGERKALKAKVAALKVQLAEAKKNHEFEMEQMRERLRVAEAKAVAIQEENQGLLQRLSGVPESKGSFRTYSPRRESVSNFLAATGSKPVPRERERERMERGNDYGLDFGRVGYGGRVSEESAPAWERPPSMINVQSGEPGSYRIRQSDSAFGFDLASSKTSILGGPTGVHTTRNDPYFSEGAGIQSSAREPANLDLAGGSFARRLPSTTRLSATTEVEPRGSEAPDFIKMFKQEIDGILTKNRSRNNSIESALSRPGGGSQLGGRGVGVREDGRPGEAYQLGLGDSKENSMKSNYMTNLGDSGFKHGRSNSLSGIGVGRLGLGVGGRAPPRTAGQGEPGEGDEPSKETQGILRFQRVERQIF